MRTWMCLLLALLFLPLAAQEDTRFEVFLRDPATNLGKTGQTVYIVHMVTGDSLALSGVSGKAGLYRREDVALGNYKIYVNGVLNTTKKFHATDRIYTLFNAIDADEDNLIAGTAMEDASIPQAKLGADVLVFDRIVTSRKASTNDDSTVIDISSYGYSNPPSVVLLPKSNWTIALQSVTAAQVVVSVGFWGTSGVDSVEFDMFLIDND